MTISASSRPLDLNTETTKVIIDNVSTYSGGFARDAAGDLYVGDTDNGNGVVGTSDDRRATRSIPRSTLAPASLATARARSLVATDMAQEAIFRRRPTPCTTGRPARGGVDIRCLTSPLNRFCDFIHPIDV